MRAAHGDPQLNRRRCIGTDPALADLRSIHAPPSKKCGQTDGKQGNQARLAFLSRGLLLARPPQPYGAENSYGKVQNVVTDCSAACQTFAFGTPHRSTSGSSSRQWSRSGRSDWPSSRSMNVPPALFVPCYVPVGYTGNSIEAPRRLIRLRCFCCPVSCADTLR